MLKRFLLSIYLQGYQGRLFPRWIRRVFAGTEIHRAWLSGFLGLFREGESDRLSSVCDRATYHYRDRNAETRRGMPRPMNPTLVQQLQMELDSHDFLSGERFELIERLKSAVLEELTALLRAGTIPVYRVTPHMAVAIHPSAHSEGMYQVTRYAGNGLFGDSQYHNLDDVLSSEGLWFRERLSEQEGIAWIEKSIAAEDWYQRLRVFEPDDALDTARSTM